MSKQSDTPTENEKKHSKSESCPYIVATVRAEDDSTYMRWLTSLNLISFADKLLDLVYERKETIDHIGIPFIVTLCTFLEAIINDHLQINILRKHGKSYLPYYQALEKAPLKTRMMFAVELESKHALRLVETDNTIAAVKELLTPA